MEETSSLCRRGSEGRRPGLDTRTKVRKVMDGVSKSRLWNETVLEWTCSGRVEEWGLGPIKLSMTKYEAREDQCLFSSRDPEQEPRSSKSRTKQVTEKGGQRET